MLRSNYSIISPKNLPQMREACALAADTLVMISHHIKAGITTNDINQLVHDYTIKNNATPAPLNYRGFPKSVCTSVNEVVCHGIPEDRLLLDGDIINVDVTSILPKNRGWFGDTSATFYVGTPSPQAKRVVEVARKSLDIGISKVGPGVRLGDIAWAIQSYAEGEGCSVVRSYTGHGIGREFHMEPNVPHVGHPGTGVKLKRGMTFTIEPMVNIGHHEVDHLDDGWTVFTADGSLSAQFEHTLTVTAHGCEVLTRRKDILINSEDKPWTIPTENS
jgi:methionyl aminopeptidase